MTVRCVGFVVPLDAESRRLHKGSLNYPTSVRSSDSLPASLYLDCRDATKFFLFAYQLVVVIPSASQPLEKMVRYPMAGMYPGRTMLEELGLIGNFGSFGDIYKGPFNCERNIVGKTLLSFKRSDRTKVCRLSAIPRRRPS